jgi:hypothetical protein
MTSRQYDAIDERIAAEIKRLHERHPKLGHNGLLQARRQAQIHVDPDDLARFMKTNRIKPERECRPWRCRGLPRSWISGSPARWSAGTDPEECRIGDKK